MVKEMNVGNRCADDHSRPSAKLFMLSHSHPATNQISRCFRIIQRTNMSRIICRRMELRSSRSHKDVIEKS